MVVIVECVMSMTGNRRIRSKLWWSSADAARWMLRVDAGVHRWDGPGGTRA